jgi:hypothetical protein
VCFSATGSFTAAGVLAGLGVASVARNEVPSLRMFAAVPLLFAAQQAAEGVVWLTIDERPPGVVARLAVVVFLGFALVLWPAWLPAALRLPEKDPRRRRILAALSWAGIATAAVSAILLVRASPSAHVARHSVAYAFGSGALGDSVLPLLCYMVPTVAPFFVSSLSLTRIIGVVLFGALVITIVTQRQALTSVWCFFAALLSALILAVVAQEGSKLRPPLPGASARVRTAP